MDYKPKRSSDGYIQLNKKITNKEVIKIVSVLSTEWLLSPSEVCYRFIADSAAREIKKKEQIEQFKKQK
jgi:hypothetical protein